MLEKTEGAIKKGQSRETGNLWVHKTHDEDNKYNTTQKTQMMSNMDTSKDRSEPRHPRRVSSSQGRIQGGYPVRPPLKWKKYDFLA